jgi:hypothetical protein
MKRRRAIKRRERFVSHLRAMKKFKREIDITMSNIPGWDEEDSAQEAALAFCEARESYKPWKARFSTHLFNRSGWHRLNLYRREMRYYGRKSNKSPSKVPRDVDRSANLLEIQTVLRSAPDDVRRLLEILWGSPGDFLKFMEESERQRPTVKLLAKYMGVSVRRARAAVDWIRKGVLPYL